MCLFVSASDEVFGTLRMYGAAVCCDFRVHGRNVVLWAPLSDKHPMAVSKIMAPHDIMSKIRPSGSMAARGRPSALRAAQGVLPWSPTERRHRG